MKARYLIVHHPGLFTSIQVERDDGSKQEIENRFTWAVSREYCRDGCKSRGIEPVIERPQPHVEIFPWITI